MTKPLHSSSSSSAPHVPWLPTHLDLVYRRINCLLMQWCCNSHIIPASFMDLDLQLYLVATEFEGGVGAGLVQAGKLSSTEGRPFVF